MAFIVILLRGALVHFVLETCNGFVLTKHKRVNQSKRSTNSVLWLQRRNAPFGFALKIRGGGGTSNENIVQDDAIDAMEDVLREFNNTNHIQPLPYLDPPEQWKSPNKKALVLMDAFAPYHGVYLADRARHVYGVAIVNVLSTYMTGYFLTRGGEEEFYLPKCMPSTPAQVDEYQKQLMRQVDEVVGVYCESDSGLAHAERLAKTLNVTHHNGMNPARRDKHLMNQLLRESTNMTVVNQRLCVSLDEALEFATQLEKNCTRPTDMSKDATRLGVLGNNIGVHPSQENEPFCVAKPIRGVGSEAVFLCTSLADVKTAFGNILGTTIFGSPGRKHDCVLIQEYLAGTEYAIDTVTRNGEHKIVALWQYDKRQANGAPVVYYATELVNAETELGKTIYSYVRSTLDALGIQWGMTHTEVIVKHNNASPVLVEVNCRQHNTDFSPLTTFCIGYNALDVLLSSYLGDCTSTAEFQWEDIPVLASTEVCGAIVHLVNSANGTLESLNVEALQEIESMPSVAAIEVYPEFCQPGNTIEPTVDIRTDAGWIHLIHENAAQFQSDYNRIVELMPLLFVTR